MGSARSSPRRAVYGFAAGAATLKPSIDVRSSRSVFGLPARTTSEVHAFRRPSRSQDIAAGFANRVASPPRNRERWSHQVDLEIRTRRNLRSRPAPSRARLSRVDERRQTRCATVARRSPRRARRRHLVSSDRVRSCCRRSACAISSRRPCASSAPPPACALQSSSVNGQPVAPTTGSPEASNATVTLTNGSPLTRFVVPSTGSTTQTHGASRSDSARISPTTGIDGVASCSNLRIAASEAPSTAVTYSSPGISPTRFVCRSRPA